MPIGGQRVGADTASVAGPLRVRFCGGTWSRDHAHTQGLDHAEH